MRIVLRARGQQRRHEQHSSEYMSCPCVMSLALSVAAVPSQDAVFYLVSMRVFASVSLELAAQRRTARSVQLSRRAATCHMSPYACHAHVVSISCGFNRDFARTAQPSAWCFVDDVASLESLPLPI